MSKAPAGSGEPDAPLRWSGPFPVLPLPRTRSAVDAFVNAYFDPVIEWIEPLVHDHDLALDLTQTVFETFLKRRPKLAPDTYMPKFFDALIRVEVRAHFRRLQVRGAREVPVDMSNDAYHGATSASSDVVEARDLLQVTAAELGRMKDEVRTAVIMRCCHENTFPEIAEVLDKPAATVKTWVHRAIAELGEALDLALEERLPGEEPKLPERAREALAAAAKPAKRSPEQRKKDLQGMMVFLGPSLPKTWLKLKIGAAVVGAGVATVVVAVAVPPSEWWREMRPLLDGFLGRRPAPAASALSAPPPPPPRPVRVPNAVADGDAGPPR
jgi:RNA polymerase sigma factor (sigma-70 family)